MPLIHLSCYSGRQSKSSKNTDIHHHTGSGTQTRWRPGVDGYTGRLQFLSQRMPGITNHGHVIDDVLGRLLSLEWDWCHLVAWVVLEVKAEHDNHRGLGTFIASGFLLKQLFHQLVCVVEGNVTSPIVLEDAVFVDNRELVAGLLHLGHVVAIEQLTEFVSLVILVCQELSLAIPSDHTIPSTWVLLPLVLSFLSLASFGFHVAS